MTRRRALLLAIVVVLAGVPLTLWPSPVSRPSHVHAAGALGTGWEKYDLIVSPGDWDQKPNQAPDMVARAISDGSLWLFSGDGHGGYSGPTKIASDWGSYTKLVGAGAFRGAGRPADLMAVRTDGELLLFPNLGKGEFGTPRSLGPGWEGYDVLLGGIDFNGDKKPDVIARSAVDGSLTLYTGDGHGGFSGHRLITSVDFSGYSLLTSPGDWDNDGFPDLVGRRADGTLCLFRGDGVGGLQNTSCIAIGSGWGAFNAILAPGAWDTHNQVDLLARTPDGNLWLGTGDGISGYSDPVSLPQCSILSLHISSVSPAYTIKIQRFGQVSPETVATLSQTNGHVQAIPADASSNGANWAPSVIYSDTCAWKSGLYGAQLATTVFIASTGASLSETAYITFVVRPLAPPTTRQLLVVASTNTWTAYNDWPNDGSFYDGRPPRERPTQVSYLRPNPGANPLAQGSHLAGGEVQILKWLTAHNFAYQMVSDVDLNDSPSILSTANYYAVLLSTHSEYWTNPMYNAVARYLQDGGSVLSLSGNTMYRKETLAKPPHGGQWSSVLIGGVNPIRSPYAVGNLIGLQFVSTINTCAAYHVVQPRSWLMAGVSSRTIGAQGQYWTPGCYMNAAGVGAGASGREVDRTLPFLLNRHYQVVAIGDNPKQGADLVWYVRRGGGQVVNVGSISFGNSLAIDANLSRIVINALTAFQHFHDTGQSSFGGLIAPGNWYGDGQPDLMARRGDNLYLYRGTGPGSLVGPTFISRGWARYNLIASAGNWIGHARPDLLARRASDGALFIAPNNGLGGFSRFLRIGPKINWSSYDTIMGVGDWNGDDIPDLIARTTLGELYLFTGSGRGQIDPTPRLLATGWDSYDQIVGPLDWNHDGIPDLITRKPDGTMWIVLGRSDHTLAPPQEIPFTGGWDNFSTIVEGGDWIGDGSQDLVARRSDGSLWLFPGIVNGSFRRSLQISDGWNAFS